MIELLNPIAALLTIAFGGFGLVAPRYTANVLDLAPKDTTMGLSEMRASAGGLFVALGLAAILTGSASIYLGLGIAYAGAATGRLLSIVLDGAPRPKAGIYFAIELILALWLIPANIAAL